MYNFQLKNSQPVLDKLFKLPICLDLSIQYLTIAVSQLYYVLVEMWGKSLNFSLNLSFHISELG